MKTGAGTRLVQLLAMTAYLAEHGPATFVELGARFGIAPERVAVELERATLYEYPGEIALYLFDLEMDDHGVTAIRVAEPLRRPPRLTQQEGFAVLTAGQAILAVDDRGQDALRSALDAVGKAMLLSAGSIAVDASRTRTVDNVADAARECRSLDMTYYTAYRDEVSEHRVDPVVVHLSRGRWYLDAFDHSRDRMGKFRIDRITAVADAGEVFDPIDVPDQLTTYTPGPDARAVRVDLPATANWVTETYPHRDRIDGPDGRFQVTFDVVGATWLERLLLRLGPEARVLDPDDLAAVGADAADRLLDLYR